MAWLTFSVCIGVYVPLLRADRVWRHGRCHKFADAGGRVLDGHSHGSKQPRGAKDLEQRAATQQTSLLCCDTELLREASSRRVLAVRRL